MLFTFGPQYELLVIILALCVWVGLGLWWITAAREAGASPAWILILQIGWCVGGIFYFIGVTWGLLWLRSRIDRDDEDFPQKTQGPPEEQASSEEGGKIPDKDP